MTLILSYLEYEDVKTLKMTNSVMYLTIPDPEVPANQSKEDMVELFSTEPINDEYVNI